MLRIYSYLILLTLFTSIQLVAQDKDYSYRAGLKGGYGFIIPHSPAMEFITAQHISKFELFFEKNTFGDRDWQQRYHFPTMGITLNYFNLNNPRNLGNAYSIAPYLNFNLAGKKYLKLKLRTALGVGYIEHPFDALSNFKNTAIGSNINLYFSILLETEIRLTNRLGMTVGANFSHFSNTSFKKPNKGINIPTIESGLNYSFGKTQERTVKDLSNFDVPKGFWRASLAFGLNEIYPANGDKYFASYGSIGYEKRLSAKGSIGGNFDVFYNPAQKAALARDSIFIDAGWENTQLGISADYTVHFGKFESYLLVGYYLKKEDDEITDIYTIFGGRVHISERINLMLALKTHVASAEYLLLGMGYKLGSK